MRPHAALLVLACAAAGQAAAQGAMSPRDFALKARRVITLAGPDLEPGIVVVRGGRIAAVGSAVTVPEGMTVVDAGSGVVMPGFVEAHSTRGLDRTYESAANASFVRVSDALNPISIEMEDARRNGVTTLLVAPDNRAFMAGRSAIVHPHGVSIDAMIVKQDAALKISLLPSPGTSRMAHLAKLRQILAETKRWMEDRAKDRGGDDTAREALRALLQDRIPALVYCPSAEDVATAFELAREHGFHVVPVIPPEAWRAVPLLQSNRVSVVLTPGIETLERAPDGSLRRVLMAKLLSDAKVPFALTTDPYELGPQHPWYQAALAVRQGVPREEALAAVTRTPARMLGFGRSKGVIEPGADADLLVLSDDPLAGGAFVDEAYVRGARIYARRDDLKLKRLLSPGTGEPPLALSEPDEEEHDEPNAEPPATTDAERERQRRWPASPR